MHLCSGGLFRAHLAEEAVSYGGGDTRWHRLPARCTDQIAEFLGAAPAATRLSRTDRFPRSPPNSNDGLWGRTECGELAADVPIVSGFEARFVRDR